MLGTRHLTLALALFIGFAALACASSAAPADASDVSTDQRLVAADAATNDAALDAATAADAGFAASSILCPRDSGIMFDPATSACSAPGQCVAARHGLDCCGSTAIVGINRSQQSAFDAIETSCEQHIMFDMCDCLAHGPNAQDGRPVASIADAIVDCVGGVCLTRAP